MYGPSQEAFASLSWFVFAAIGGIVGLVVSLALVASGASGWLAITVQSLSMLAGGSIGKRFAR